MLTNKDFYYCYSEKLKSFLNQAGFRYITVGLHPASKRKFYQYEITDELSKALLDWTQTGISEGYIGRK